MTEKVVSLSGGLVLGMVFALFLGIGATQSLAPSAHFEIPSILQMTIAQATHSTSTPANDTKPTVNVATPGSENRGRITRIATLGATTDPVFETTATTTPADPKNWEIASTPKIENSLQAANLQHSYIASNPQATSSFAALGQVVSRQGNFSAIIANTTGRSASGSQPSGVEGKPQTQGSPSVAHNNPDMDDGPAITPSITGGEPSKHEPGDPDDSSNNNTNKTCDPERPDYRSASTHHGGQSENDPGNPEIFQRGNRPQLN